MMNAIRQLHRLRVDLMIDNTKTDNDTAADIPGIEIGISFTVPCINCDAVKSVDCGNSISSCLITLSHEHIFPNTYTLLKKVK